MTDPVTGRTYIYSDQIGHLFRKAHQQGSAIFQAHSPVPELTSVQLAVLFVVATHGPQPQNQLGKLAAMDPSTVTGVVARLKERKLITLASEATDKRKVIVSLTKGGEDLVRKVAEAGHRITEEILSPLNVAERLALQMLMVKITDR